MKEMPLPDDGFIPGMCDDANDRVMLKERPIGLDKWL